MTSIAGAIGSIVTGTLRRTSAFTHAFDTHHVLGTGFVIDATSGLCVTCSHVISPEDITAEEELAFFALSESEIFTVHPIIKSSARRNPDLDVMTFRVQQPASLRRTWGFGSKDLPLAQDVLVIGVAKDHLNSRPNANTVTPRALKSYVVAGFDVECEIDKPLITTMSGSPVLADDLIVGIASSNRQYAIDQYVTETVRETVDGVEVRKEVYEYKETSRFGVFIKSSAWSDWAISPVT